jgi:hypothetical protein
MEIFTTDDMRHLSQSQAIGLLLKVIINFEEQDHEKQAIEGL